MVDGQIRGSQRKRAANRRRNREFGAWHLRNLNPHEFRRMYRMTRASFEKLLGMIKDEITSDSKQAKNSSGSPIPARSKLAATIRFLAGGSYLDISAIFGMDPKNFHNRRCGPLWQTLKAIDKHLHIGLTFDEASLEQTAQRFERFSRNHMKNCVMAIDGWVVKTRKPTIAEVGPSVKSYRNRKVPWGLVVLAGCDSDCRFTMLCARNSGSSHDSIVWAGCELFRALEAGKLPSRFYIVGDEAFVNSYQLLTPWSGRGIGVWKDSFNFHLSGMRQCIERASGMRQCILWLKT